MTYGRAVQFERIEEVDASTILSIDEIEYIAMLQDVVPVLTYHPIPQEDGDEILVPAWRYTIGDSYSVYDAVSASPCVLLGNLMSVGCAFEFSSE